MKTILYIHHTKGIGGAPISMIKMIESLDHTKYHPIVLLIKDSEISKLLKQKGIEYILAPQKFYRKYYQHLSHGVPGHRWYQLFILGITSISWILSRFYYSGRVLKNIDCDIIHLNSSALTDFLYAAHLKAKTIIHFREAMAAGYFGVRKAFFRSQVNRYADHVIAISHDNARRLNLPCKTTVIYNFINPVPEQTDTYNITDHNKILYVGGALKIKGFFPLIDALDYLDEKVRVYFCGYYPVENSIKGYKKYLPSNKRLLKAVSRMRSHDKAIELGMVMDIPGLMQKCAFIISPFSVEHFSRPVIEAFAYKKPAIGSDVVGMDELIDHNINGLIVKKNDAVALAKAINYLCANPEIVKKMGEKGFEKAKRLYSPGNIRQVERIYDDILEEKK